MSRIVLRNELSIGVAAWLTYEKACGREGLFSESYMALPVAQILSNHFGGNVNAEHNHPVLSKVSKPGRPPQLDFAVKSDEDISLVVETKWVGKTNVKVEDVVWDCVRLELAANEYNCDGLFLLAGTRKAIDETLESPSFNPKNTRQKPSPVLGLYNNGRQSVNVQSPKKAFGPKLHEYINKYPSIAFPRSFVCGYGTQKNKYASGADYITAVWHIRPEVNKRFTFSV